MPQVIPMWLGIGAGAAAIAAPAVVPLITSKKEIKAAGKAADDVRDKADREAVALKNAQASASSQASQAVRKRAASRTQTVFTSPLGLSGQAATAKKRLLGE